jgi:hypothetical protein
MASARPFDEGEILSWTPKYINPDELIWKMGVN